MTGIPAVMLFKLGYYPQVALDVTSEAYPIPEAMQNEFTISISIALVLFLYVQGLAAIGISQRLRTAFTSDKPETRIARVATSKHEFILKLYTEQSAIAEAFDGIALVLVSIGMTALFLTFKVDIIFSVLFLISVASAWTMSREAGKRLRRFDGVLNQIELLEK